jgi:hypothetical protein
MPALTAIKARQQQTWAMGDYARIGLNVVLEGKSVWKRHPWRSRRWNRSKMNTYSMSL